MAKTQNSNNSGNNYSVNNEALQLALESAHKRGLLQQVPDLGVARKISIAASKYYLALTGQMAEDELETAIDAVFNYKPQRRIKAV